VGGAPAVLAGRRRAGAFALLAAAVAAYYAGRRTLPDLSIWWDVALLGLVLMPAVFGLVYLALPLRRGRGLIAVGLALAVLAVALELGGLQTAANFAKLAAVTFVAWAFLAAFEQVSWVVLVACIVPWVDAYSVWRGPTRQIVTHKRDLFRALSVAFPNPGEHGVSRLGLPDVLFFALYLAAAVRFGLRPGWTWLAMTLSFGATVALAVWLDLDGLPALPLLSLGFLLPNADLLWRRLRARGAAADAGG
jgi:hypothetical protein